MVRISSRISDYKFVKNCHSKEVNKWSDIRRLNLTVIRQKMVRNFTIMFDDFSDHYSKKFDNFLTKLNF